MLETKKCEVCGSDVVFDYVGITLSFRVQDGKLVRDDNNDAWFLNTPYVEFYCSEDRDHYIGDIGLEYMEEVEREIMNYLEDNKCF